jgi:hypothetical protein
MAYNNQDLPLHPTDAKRVRRILGPGKPRGKMGHSKTREREQQANEKAEA